MRFPPPIRFTAPLLALSFGLVATWFDYRLNLDLDLDRHLAEMRERADADGRRLAQLSGNLRAAGQLAALRADVQAMAELPQVKIVAVLDEAGNVIADSTGTLTGQSARSSNVAKAAALIQPAAAPTVQHAEDRETLISAHPFPTTAGQSGWVLLECDRTEAISAARADALTQLGWMAAAMALLSFALWAVLHFVFANRLGQLAESVRAVGEGNVVSPVSLGGSDEVGLLSTAFAAMMDKLAARDAEQMRLEREVLEISEGERQRIGRDLHDGLGQRLTAASMTSSALAIAARKIDALTLAERGEELGQQLREAIAETRALAHGLAPVALVDDGLANALQALAARTSGGGVTRCIFECPEPVHVRDSEVAGQLYRITQEAVNNALKHAQATEIRIGLERHAGQIELEIEDDGDGFTERHSPGDGIGLRVMRYRARLIGGTLEIGSAPAGGARISCRVSRAS